jgi:hypothetical protein
MEGGLSRRYFLCARFELSKKRVCNITQGRMATLLQPCGIEERA